MSQTMRFPATHQGVRDLDNPLPVSGINVGGAERAASTVGGAVIAGFGLVKGGVLGKLLLLAGIALTYRGVTGHCHAYAAAGIDTSEEGERLRGSLSAS